MPVFISKVRNYAMYPRDVLARMEHDASPLATFFHVCGWRGDDGSRLRLQVSGPDATMFFYAITRDEVEALRNMLTEVLDDWKL